MANIDTQWWIAAIGWIGCVVAFYVALRQWRSGQKVQRAEFLERLIQKFKDIKYDSYLNRVECEQEDDGAEPFDSELVAYDFLIFLSYVCYLRNTGVIKQEEFLPFECYIKRTLCIKTICDSILSIHVSNNMSAHDGPYSALLKYGIDNNISGVKDLYKEIEDNLKTERTHPMKDKITINANDGKTYSTHLDVLNGIFNKGLLAHARGVSPLDENTFVWFPHIFKDRSSAGDRLWFNLMTEDGHEIREICTNIKKLKRFSEAAKGPRRYVFAKVHQDELVSDYKFMGVYEFKRNEKETENGFCWVYERTADSLAY